MFTLSHSQNPHISFSKPTREQVTAGEVYKVK